MGYPSYYLDVVSENDPHNGSVLQKFGRNDNVGTSFVPVCFGGFYRTPQVSGATQLRVKAGNANDTSDGSGARSVFIEGIDANGELATETLATNGESAGSNSVNSYIRVFRGYVLTTGTYGTQLAGSHSADITIENAAGTEDWLTIDSNGFSRGQSEIGAYTVPKGKAAYILDFEYSVDTSKVSKLLLFRRNNILDTAAPYSAIREVFSFEALVSAGEYSFDAPLGPFEEYTDVGFLGTSNNSGGTINVAFSILVRDKE